MRDNTPGTDIIGSEVDNQIKTLAVRAEDRITCIFITKCVFADKNKQTCVCSF